MDTTAVEIIVGMMGLAFGWALLDSWQEYGGILVALGSWQLTAVLLCSRPQRRVLRAVMAGTWTGMAVFCWLEEHSALPFAVVLATACWWVLIRPAR